MKNGTYVVRLDLRDECEIAELHNGKWYTFRSLQQKYSEKDMIYTEIVFPDATHSAEIKITNSWNDPNSVSSERFPELSIVSLRSSVDVPGGMTLPVGAKGAIVHAYPDGIGYEVEFIEPFQAVVTVNADNLLKHI
jgi:hypothetical protein